MCPRPAGGLYPVYLYLVCAPMSYVLRVVCVVRACGTNACMSCVWVAPLLASRASCAGVVCVCVHSEIFWV